MPKHLKTSALRRINFVVIAWLASYPRSGSTLFRMILRKRHGLMTHSVYDDPDLTQMGAASTVGHAGRAPIEKLMSSSRSHLVKTHRLPEDALPAVYIVRDGRDVCVSFAHYRVAAPNLTPEKRANRTPPSFEECLRQVIVGDPVYGRWSHHVDGWMDPARGGSVQLVRYEDLVSSPEAVVTEALKAVGMRRSRIGSLRRRPLPSFEDLNRMWPDFFRRGREHSWRDEMPSELHELFWEYHGATMGRLGYVR
ncbi:MAG TPA: sulfotransferase domain-containing protein [Actinomycetota bacterium]|nr:sulfotransferase domain-containing protein [Actinomycetota bacterium]